MLGLFIVSCDINRIRPVVLLCDAAIYISCIASLSS